MQASPEVQRPSKQQLLRASALLGLRAGWGQRRIRDAILRGDHCDPQDVPGLCGLLQGELEWATRKSSPDRGQSVWGRCSQNCV